MLSSFSVKMSENEVKSDSYSCEIFNSKRVLWMFVDTVWHGSNKAYCKRLFLKTLKESAFLM